jgi:hypothetical protein
LSSNITNNFNNQIKKTKNLYLNSTRFKFQDSSDNAALNDVRVGGTLYVSKITSNQNNAWAIPFGEIQIADEQLLHVLSDLTVDGETNLKNLTIGNIATIENLIATTAKVTNLTVENDLIPNKLRIKNIYSVNSTIPIASTYGAYSDSTDYTDQSKLLTYGLYECSGDLWIYNGESSNDGIHFGTNGSSVQISSREGKLGIYKDNSHTAYFSTNGISIQNNAGNNNITLKLNTDNSNDIIAYENAVQNKRLFIGEGYINTYLLNEDKNTYCNIDEELRHGQLLISAIKSNESLLDRYVSLTPMGLQLRNNSNEITYIDFVSANKFSISMTTISGTGDIDITNNYFHYMTDTVDDKYSVTNIYPSYCEFTILTNSANLGQYQFNETGLVSFTADNKSIVGFNQIATNGSELTLKAVSSNINLSAEVINIDGKLSINSGLEEITIDTLNNTNLNTNIAKISTLTADSGKITQIKTTNLSGNTAFIDSVSSTNTDTETIYVDKITSNTKFTESDNGISENEIQVAEGQTFHVLNDLIVDGKADINEVNIENLTVDKVEANEISLRTITPTTMAVGASESDEEIEAVSEENIELKIKNVENKMHIISTEGIELDSDTNISGSVEANGFALKDSNGKILATNCSTYSNEDYRDRNRLLTYGLNECSGQLYVYEGTNYNDKNINFNSGSYIYLDVNQGLHMYYNNSNSNSNYSLDFNSNGLNANIINNNTTSNTRLDFSASSDTILYSDKPGSRYCNISYSNGYWNQFYQTDTSGNSYFSQTMLQNTRVYMDSLAGKAVVAYNGVLLRSNNNSNYSSYDSNFSINLDGSYTNLFLDNCPSGTFSISFRGAAKGTTSANEAEMYYMANEYPTETSPNCFYFRQITGKRLNYFDYVFQEYNAEEEKSYSSRTRFYKDTVEYDNGITFTTLSTGLKPYFTMNNPNNVFDTEEHELNSNSTIIGFRSGSKSISANSMYIGEASEDVNTIAYIFDIDGLEAYTNFNDKKLTLKGFDIIDAKEFLINGQPLTVGSSNEINIDHLQVDEIYTTTKTKVNDDEETVEYGNNLSISFTDNDNNTVNTKFNGSIESNGFILKDSSGKPLASNYGTYQSGTYENKSQLLTYGLYECSGNLYVYSGGVTKDTDGNSIINFGTNNANYINLSSSNGLNINYDSGSSTVNLIPSQFNMRNNNGSYFKTILDNTNLIEAYSYNLNRYNYWGNGFINMYHPTSGSEGSYVYEQLQNGQLTIARNNTSYYGAGSRYIQIKPNLIQMRCATSSEKATIDVASEGYLIDFASTKGSLIVDDNKIYYTTDLNQTNISVFYQTSKNSKYTFIGTVSDSSYEDSIYLQYDGIIATGDTEKTITGFNTITTTNVNTNTIEVTTINAPVIESTDTSTTTETLTLNATTVNIVGNLTINGESISNSVSNDTSNNSSLNYVICETDGATNIKEITIDGFTPTMGSTITIEFTNTGTTEDNIKFNINNTEYSVYANGTELKNNLLKADNVYMFIYNGTTFKSLNAITDETEIEETLNKIVNGSVSNEEIVSEMEDLVSIDE